MTAKKVEYNSNEHNAWIRGLDFYNQELGFLTERLQEIASDNTKDEVLQEVENFQDQFIIHQRYIDDLKNDIHQFLNGVANQIESTGFVDERCLAEKAKLREKYISEEKLFNEMRHEFYRFAEEWM
jgi:hypothetical protein